MIKVLVDISEKKFEWFYVNVRKIDEKLEKCPLSKTKWFKTANKESLRILE